MSRILNSCRTAIWLGLALVIAQVCTVQTCAAYSCHSRRDRRPAWKGHSPALLKKRFPAATDDDLKERPHAFGLRAGS